MWGGSTFFVKGAKEYHPDQQQLEKEKNKKNKTLLMAKLGRQAVELMSLMMEFSPPSLIGRFNISAAVEANFGVEAVDAAAAAPPPGIPLWWCWWVGGWGVGGHLIFIVTLVFITTSSTCPESLTAPELRGLTRCMVSLVFLFSSSVVTFRLASKVKKVLLLISG